MPVQNFVRELKIELCSMTGCSALFVFSFDGKVDAFSDFSLTNEVLDRPDIENNHTNKIIPCFSSKMQSMLQSMSN